MKWKSAHLRLGYICLSCTAACCLFFLYIYVRIGPGHAWLNRHAVLTCSIGVCTPGFHTSKNGTNMHSPCWMAFESDDYLVLMCSHGFSMCFMVHPPENQDFTRSCRARALQTIDVFADVRHTPSKGRGGGHMTCSLWPWSAAQLDPLISALTCCCLHHIDCLHYLGNNIVLMLDLWHCKNQISSRDFIIKLEMSDVHRRSTWIKLKNSFTLFPFASVNNRGWENRVGFLPSRTGFHRPSFQQITMSVIYY